MPDNATRTSPRFPARQRRGLAGDLDNIVLKALRKEPERRYASVEQFAEDIRRHISGLPLTATPDSVSYRFRKFVHRHRAGVAASLLIVLVVLTGIAATLREGRIAKQNQLRAERRFNDVRRLSDSLLFELHDAIRDLPGATPARKLLVQRSLESLSALAADSAGDISLQRELANAYERTAMVQGGPTGSNLGDISGAVDSFTKAMNIRESIVKHHAAIDASDLTALASSYREMCGMNARYLSDIDTALKYCQRALDVVEPLHKQSPSDRSVTEELIKVYDTTGRVYGENSTSGNAGDSYKALQDHHAALDLVDELLASRPGDPNYSDWKGSMSLLTADDLFEIGHVSEAVPMYRQATQIFEDLVAKSTNPTYTDSLALSYQRMGDMALVSGQFEQSLPYYRKQLELSIQLLAADPRNVGFRTSVIASRATLGHGLWRAGHIKEGISTLKQGLAELEKIQAEGSKSKGLGVTLQLWLAGALEREGDQSAALHYYMLGVTTYEAICKDNPKDLEDCLGLAGVEDRIGRIYAQRSNFDLARERYKEALALVEPLSRGEKFNLEALYTVVNSYYDLGESFRMQAGKQDTKSARDRLLSQACNFYQMSRVAFLRIPEWHPITPNEFDARSVKEIDGGLSSCRVLAR
jgi:tetratricopeptide (TPR) repeat protein